MSPPLLQDVPRRGTTQFTLYTCGVLQPAAKVTQFTFGFSTWTFCFLFLYSLLLVIQSRKILNFALLENPMSTRLADVPGRRTLRSTATRTGNAYYTQLFNKWQFYPLPCTVWTWTLDNVRTYFCDILMATLKLNLTYVGSY